MKKFKTFTLMSAPELVNGITGQTLFPTSTPWILDEVKLPPYEFSIDITEEQWTVLTKHILKHFPFYSNAANFSYMSFNYPLEKGNLELELALYPTSNFTLYFNKEGLESLISLLATG